MFSKLIASAIHPVNLVEIRSFALCCLFGVTAIFFHKPEIPSPKEASIIALSAFTGPFLARLLFMYSLKTVDLAKASLLGQIEPFFTAILSFAIFKDIPTEIQWFGGFLILSGTSLIIQLESKRT